MEVINYESCDKATDGIAYSRKQHDYQVRQTHRVDISKETCQKTFSWLFTLSCNGILSLPESTLAMLLSSSLAGVFLLWQHHMIPLVGRLVGRLVVVSQLRGYMIVLLLLTSATSRFLLSIHPDGVDSSALR